MKKLIILAALVPALMTACSKDDKPDKKDDAAPPVGVTQAAGTGITVTDTNGQAIPNAQILIGDAANVPFTGNFLTADANGQMDLPTAWTSAETVTVGASGYVRMSYVNQSPGAITFQLHKASTAQKYLLQGNATGLVTKDYDGNINFGLVMPALSKSNLLNFDIGSVISSQSDHISTLGQDLAIPSNLSLPNQKEHYSILTATLNKPLYRMSFDQPGITRMYVIRGQFPFKSTADALRGGKSFFDVINSISLTGGGVRDINLTAAQSSLDLPVTDMNFTDSRKVTAPSTLQADETFLAVAATEQSGYMIPTDLKNVAKGQSMNLGLLPNVTTQLLGVLKKTADMQTGAPTTPNPMSTTLLPFTAGATPQFLPLIAAPKRTNTGDLILPTVSPISGVQPYATYSVLSQVTSATQDGKVVETVNHLWEVYSPTWASDVQIPTWPNDPPISGVKRWDVSFIGGSQNSSQPQMGAAIIQSATHVTHSSLDF